MGFILAKIFAEMFVETTALTNRCIADNELQMK